MEKIIYTVARTNDQLASTDEFIHRMYSKQGYVAMNETGESSGISRFLYASNATTFTAHDAMKSSIFGTLSIFLDAGPHTIPMDDLYISELVPYREEGFVCAEVGQFAIDAQGIRQTGFSRKDELGISMTLFRHVFYYALHNEVTHLLITVNPKHRQFYELLGFTIFADIKNYASVNDAPAVPMVLNVSSFEQSNASSNGIVQEILSYPIAEEEFTHM